MEKFIENLYNLEKSEIIALFENMMDDAYAYIQWPDSQDLMEEEWFEDEAILNIEEGSCYFVPLKRLYD